MKATILDLRRRMAEVLRALDRNETVTILYRGRIKAILIPASQGQRTPGSVREHPAFGMWRDRSDMEDVAGYVRRLREARFDAL